MRKLLALTACASLYSIVQLVSGCADPLDNGQTGPVSPEHSNTDTIVIVDTTYIVDSVFIIDTTIIIDTVTHTDTVIVERPEDDDSAHNCSRIGSNEHDIVWLLQNKPGDYHLQFAALAERDKPIQTAVLDIDGRKVCWNPAEQPNLTVDQFLKENAIMRIELSEPCAYGHSIDICFVMSLRK